MGVCSDFYTLEPQVNYFQHGDGKDLFGEQQSLAVTAAHQAQERVQAIARRHIPKENGWQ